MSRELFEELSDQELMRYSRQIMLPKFDVAGQLALKNSNVLIAGMGGLGSPAALYLAAAGVGKLTIVDHDVVDTSNLQRQVIHGEASLGLPKVESARERLQEINPLVQVHSISQKLEGDAILALIQSADLVLDCTDNFATRFAINKYCVQSRKPLVSGAAIRMEGQISVFDPRQAENPCYQCLYPEGDEQALSCSEAGVMSPLVGIIGSMQAMEAIKLLSGLGETLTGKLLMLDAMSMQWRSLKLKKDPDCSCCSVG